MISKFHILGQVNTVKSDYSDYMQYIYYNGGTEPSEEKSSTSKRSNWLTRSERCSIIEPSD